MSIAFLVGTIGTRAGGMETYETYFLRALAEVEKKQDYHLLCLGDDVKTRLGIDQPNFRYTQLPALTRPINLGLLIPGILLFSKAKLLHPTYVPPALCPLPYVYTVHSSVTWAHPELYPSTIRWRLNYLQEKGIREARMVLCVSQHVKDFIQERFKIPSEKLAVVYHGVSPLFQPRFQEPPQPILKEKYGIDAPYFLFVGKLTENKNIRRLLQAFKAFREKTDKSIRLVLAGRRLWSRGQLDHDLDQAVAQGSVIELGHLSHEDLPPLYSGALGLVFPSLWEGFGLPILEAFASGIPVLTSNNSALPEIAGAQAIFADPLSTEEITHGMIQMTTDSELCSRLVQGGLQRVREFTWQRTAEQTSAAYAKALAQ